MIRFGSIFFTPVMRHSRSSERRRHAPPTRPVQHLKCPKQAIAVTRATPNSSTSVPHARYLRLSHTGAVVENSSASAAERYPQMKDAISTRVALADEENCSEAGGSGGSESDYDFVNTPPSSPRATASGSPSPSRLPLPAKGWDAFDVSDTASAGTSGKFASVPLMSAENSTVGATATSSSGGKGPLFNCAACACLLRDCVECPRCHSLFCRSHLLGSDDHPGKSPCPCEPCCSGSKTNSSISSNNNIDILSFLPNVPVQRMANALPAACDACGIALSWGDLAAHMCDLQIVSCEDARWGCTWTGRRVHRAKHMSSTCKGRITRVENELAEARAELLSSRAEIASAQEAQEAAERRATTAEMRNEELEDLLWRSLREKGLSVGIPEATAALDAAATHAAARVNTPASAGAAVRDSSSARAAAPHSGAVVTIVGKTTSSTSQGLLQRQQPSPAGFRDVFKKNARQQRTTATAAAVPVAAVPRALPALQETTVQGVTVGVVEASCQAPVPATEACLKPYLERPDSLLEKKVVVFWPRQGRWYVGRPTVYKAATKEHRVEYDDGDVRDHVLAHRSWGLIG